MNAFDPLEPESAEQARARHRRARASKGVSLTITSEEDGRAGKVLDFDLARTTAELTCLRVHLATSPEDDQAVGLATARVADISSKQQYARVAQFLDQLLLREHRQVPYAVTVSHTGKVRVRRAGQGQRVVLCGVCVLCSASTCRAGCVRTQGRLLHP